MSGELAAFLCGMSLVLAGWRIHDREYLVGGLLLLAAIVYGLSWWMAP